MAKLKDEMESGNNPDRFYDGEGTGHGDGRGGKKQGRKGSALTNEDRVEREVRKRVAEMMASAGVNHGRISQEVLYWLPEDFARLYSELFSRALKLDDGVSSSMGGQVGDEGQVKARVGTGPSRGKTAGGLFTRSSGAHARGTGKRYRNHWLIKDEEAMDLKLEIDRGLRKLGMLIENRGKGRGRGKAGDEKNGGRGEPGGMRREGDGEKGSETREDDLVKFISGDGGGKSRRLLVGRNQQVRCEGCGKIAKREWVTCPFSHA